MTLAIFNNENDYKDRKQAQLRLDECSIVNIVSEVKANVLDR